jgi:transposase
VLTLDDYCAIRLARRDGSSIRQIARTLGHSRRKVREALANPQPEPYTRSKPVTHPKLGPFLAIIAAILAEDERAPRKQRHTAMQLHRRLVAEHGYRGGYDAVRRHVARLRRRSRPSFIPLDHPAGRRLEADFGHIHVDYPADQGGRRRVAVLVLTWSFSHAVFAMKLPSERLESVLLGIVSGLAFFGCVPRELWWDNPTTVAAAVLRGRQRRVQQRYAALASHYCFEPRFCMPGAAWEKPDVEHRVYDLQRRFATPVPQVDSDEQLNQRLRHYCLSEMQRTVAGRTQTIGQMFEQDKAAAAPLPSHPFDPCVHVQATVDHYQTVRHDKVRYSVPRGCPRGGDGPVTVKVYADRIAVVDQGEVVAMHPRRYEAGSQLDPLHYLATLSRRPMALDHAAVYRQWQLPPALGQLRQALETRHGHSAGVRQYIQVLQLMAEHPLTRIEQAAVAALAGEPAMLDGPLICQQVRQMHEQGEADHDQADLPASVPRVEVPGPDLGRFNQLLATEPSPSIPSLQGDHVCQTP